VICAGGVAGKIVRMSSARFGTGGEEEVPLGCILMERDGVPTSRRTMVPVREGGGPSSRRVLDVGDRTTHTIVFVLHEETVISIQGWHFTGVYFLRGG
jgi:hypothetical protein